MQKKENINHPDHYKNNSIETIRVIEDWKLGFNLGNVVKYISRAGKKNPKAVVEDLQKAQWYLNREITNLMAEDDLIKIAESMSGDSDSIDATLEKWKEASNPLEKASWLKHLKELLTNEDRYGG